MAKAAQVLEKAFKAFLFVKDIVDELTGGTPPQNADVVRRVLKGEHGAHRNIVLLNAAAGLVVAGAAESLEEAVIIATSSIDEGHAARTLDRWVHESQAVMADLQSDES